MANVKKILKERRQKRIRSTISGSAERPRLTVFRSNKFVYAQLVDDAKGHTIAAHSSMESKAKTALERSKEVGLELAKKAIAAKVKKVVFDRSGYIYTGNIKAIADGAREGGLEF